MDWAAIRAEYVAGGISLAALAEKHGARPGALRRLSREQGWVAARAAAKAVDTKPGAEAAGAAEAGREPGAEAAGGTESGREPGAEAAGGTDAGVDPAEDGAGDEVKIARHTRRALLLMLQRAAEAIPCDATEIKTTGDGGEVKLLKLRDLTAAYKELVSDLPADEAEGGSRVIIDI